MESAELSIKEAQQLVSSPVARAEGRIDWELVMQRFEKYKVLDSGDVRPGTFERLYRPVLNQVREVVRTRPIPRDGRSVLAALRDTYGGAPGSPGRRLRIRYAAQLLHYAVAQMGAPARWGTPDDLVPLIGRRDAAQKNPATPAPGGRPLTPSHQPLLQISRCRLSIPDRVARDHRVDV